jgi:hypothetical protein
MMLSFITDSIKKYLFQRTSKNVIVLQRHYNVQSLVHCIKWCTLVHNQQKNIQYVRLFFVHFVLKRHTYYNVQSVSCDWQSWLYNYLERIFILYNGWLCKICTLRYLVTSCVHGKVDHLVFACAIQSSTTITLHLLHCHDVYNSVSIIVAIPYCHNDTAQELYWRQCDVDNYIILHMISNFFC